MDYKNKYLKYKRKYINYKSLIGGKIEANNILKKIKSIGFEFETNQMSFFNVYDEKNLTNSDINPTTHELFDKQIFDINDTNDTNFIFSINYDTPRDSSPVHNINSLYSSKDIHKKIHIGEYTCRSNQKFKHSEFHVTYTNITSNPNSIYFYLYDACKRICNFFDSLDIFENQEIVISDTDPNYISRSDNEPYIVSSQAIIYREDNRRIYIIPNKKKINNIRTINWIIQMTIGIQIENYISIVNYLLFKEGYINKNWENAKRVSKKIYDIFLDLYNSCYIYRFFYLMFLTFHYYLYFYIYHVIIYYY